MKSPGIWYRVDNRGSISIHGVLISDQHIELMSDPDDAVTDKNECILNLYTRQIIPAIPHWQAMQAYFEEHAGTPERLMASVVNGEFGQQFSTWDLLPLLTESAQAEWKSIAEVAAARFNARRHAASAELDNCLVAPRSELARAESRTFWIRLLHMIWPPAKTRYETARLVANRRYLKVLDPMRQKRDKENDAACKEYEKVIISAWVDLFSKPENRIESWR